jgi:hypothetical protein
MAKQFGRPDRAPALTNRRSERGVLDQLVDAVRAGESRVLVVRGDGTLQWGWIVNLVVWLAIFVAGAAWSLRRDTARV